MALGFETQGRLGRREVGFLGGEGAEAEVDGGGESQRRHPGGG